MEDRYDLQELKIVTDKIEKGKETVHIHGKVNPERDGDKVDRSTINGNLVERIRLKEVYFKLPANNNTHSEFKRQLRIQENELNEMLVKNWLLNRYAFMRRSIIKGEGRDPKGDKEIAELRESIRRDIADNYARLNTRRLRSEGKSNEEIIIIAENYALSIFGKNKVILHNPDQIAGG